MIFKMVAVNLKKINS